MIRSFPISNLFQYTIFLLFCQSQEMGFLYKKQADAFVCIRLIDFAYSGVTGSCVTISMMNSSRAVESAELIILLASLQQFALASC